ncbi:hypothetical protein V6N11_011426 [Hibiscus sabdariffa]|uniref:Uncharacterized protein n=1 Tax=Hibiscus sabdariffa TaxID=183260 RepID=A0ABR2S877_9ROSI
MLIGPWKNRESRTQGKATLRIKPLASVQYVSLNPPSDPKINQQSKIQIEEDGRGLTQTICSKYHSETDSRSSLGNSGHPRLPLLARVSTWQLRTQTPILPATFQSMTDELG